MQNAGCDGRQTCYAEPLSVSCGISLEFGNETFKVSGRKFAHQQHIGRVGTSFDPIFDDKRPADLGIERMIGLLPAEKVGESRIAVSQIY